MGTKHLIQMLSDVSKKNGIIAKCILLYKVETNYMKCC